MLVTVKTTALWDVMPCCLEEITEVLGEAAAFIYRVEHRGSMFLQDSSFLPVCMHAIYNCIFHNGAQSYRLICLGVWMLGLIVVYGNV
jgi:hypothetical protein